ncbi:MAG: MarR family transcriptional regulator [Bacillota bacterium]
MSKRPLGALTEFLQGELRVLFYLSLHRQREVYPSLLSEKLHVSRPRITAALAALRAKGYVRARASPRRIAAACRCRSPRAAPPTSAPSRRRWRNTSTAWWRGWGRRTCAI